MDEISFRILRILQEKARIPNVDVARQVGMAPSAVLERIRKMEKQGIIDGYEVRLNPRRFGRSMVAFMTVKTRPPVPQPKLAERLAAITAVQEVHYLSGGDGYLVKLRVSGADELNALLQDPIGAMASVCEVRTAIVLETTKETARLPLEPESPAP
jgi:Lrp/AsnC family leucine-responsive transcriptional regulator